MVLLYVTLIFLPSNILGAVNSKDPEWTGIVFPDLRNENLRIEEKGDHDNRIPMGVNNSKCDWGEDPKGFDGDLGPNSYTCFDDKSLFNSNPTVHPILRKDYIPKSYIPWHHCMNESIIYDKIIPTFGDHRPLWPKYGEYSFLPKQRWVHSLEHGSIVMLYHPCADRNEVGYLRKILKDCLYQFIITTLNELKPERPLVLVAWGVSLEMSKVDPKIVMDFIRKYAYKAPEKVYLNGQYTKNLIQDAPTELQGKIDNVCPNF